MLGHDLTHHNAVAATCTKPGKHEYWKCEREGCGKLFMDSKGETSVESLDMLTIGAQGHNFEDAKVED